LHAALAMTMCPKTTAKGSYVEKNQGKSGGGENRAGKSKKELRAGQ